MEQLRQANPICEEDALLSNDEDVWRRAIIQAERSDVSTPRQRGPRLAWVGTIVASVAAALLVVFAVLGGRSEDSTPLDQALGAAAAVAAEQPPPEANFQDQPLYEKTQEASLVTSGGPAGPWSALTSATREQWVAPDGSGRVRNEAANIEFLGERDRARWQAAGAPNLAREGADRRLEPGELSFGEDLPSDPEHLAEVIRQRAEKSDAPVAPEMLVLIGDLLRNPLTAPDVRASLYRIAASIDGVALVGEVKDPIGRAGTAVGIVSDYTGSQERYELIFNPNTSEVLAEREVLLESAPYLDAEPPVVISATTYLRSGPASSVETAP